MVSAAAAVAPDPLQYVSVPVDLVLFCVKSYDTTTAAGQIRPLIGPETVILSV